MGFLEAKGFSMCMGCTASRSMTADIMTDKVIGKLKIVIETGSFTTENLEEDDQFRVPDQPEDISYLREGSPFTYKFFFLPK